MSDDYLDRLVAASEHSTYLSRSLEKLTEAERAKVAELARKLEIAGCDQALSAALSEVTENIPQSARFAVLQTLKNDLGSFTIEDIQLEAEPEAAAQIEAAIAAVGTELLDQIVREVGRQAGWLVALMLDESQPPEGMPNWTLYEADEQGRSTGRIIQGVHEEVGEYFAAP